MILVSYEICLVVFFESLSCVISQKQIHIRCLSKQQDGAELTEQKERVCPAGLERFDVMSHDNRLAVIANGTLPNAL